MSETTRITIREPGCDRSWEFVRQEDDDEAWAMVAKDGVPREPEPTRTHWEDTLLNNVADALDALAAARRENERLRERLNAAAAVCDAWARESREGGWSTHQVKANTELANDLRRAAALRGEGGA